MNLYYKLYNKKLSIVSDRLIFWTGGSYFAIREQLGQCFIKVKYPAAE